jgi:hypothetical protein
LQVHERAADRAHLAQAEVYVIELEPANFCQATATSSSSGRTSVHRRKLASYRRQKRASLG